MVRIFRFNSHIISSRILTIFDDESSMCIRCNNSYCFFSSSCIKSLYASLFFLLEYSRATVWLQNICSPILFTYAILSWSKEFPTIFLQRAVYLSMVLSEYSLLMHRAKRSEPIGMLCMLCKYDCSIL